MNLDLTSSDLFIDTCELSNRNGRDSRPESRPNSTLVFELFELPNARLNHAFEFPNAELTHAFQLSNAEIISVFGPL